MKLVHSTSLNNFLDILKGSYDKPTGIWHVSHGDDLMYFYHLEEALINSWSYSYDEVQEFMSGEEKLEKYAITEWGWHGRMQLAACNETLNNIAVTFIVDVPEEYYNLIQVDVSCPGMQLCRTIPCDEFDPSWITEIYACEVDVLHYPFVMSTITKNDLAEVDEDTVIYRMAKLINQSEDMYNIFMDEMVYHYQEFGAGKAVQAFKKQYSEYFMRDAA